MGESQTAVFLVDDHPVVREGIRRLVDATDGLAVCGEAEDVPQALDALAAATPDVVVIDLALRNSSGLDLIRQIRERWSSLRILVLSMFEEELYAAKALRAGAHGYVMKEAPSEQLLEAIRKVAAGAMVFSPSVERHLLRHIAGGGTPASWPIADRLSDRELEVFRLIGEGHTRREVADALGLSVKTIDSHIDRIRSKLNLESGRALIQRAVEWVVRTREGGALP